jgi:hypothetical protein
MSYLTGSNLSDTEPVRYDFSYYLPDIEPVRYDISYYLPDIEPVRYDICYYLPDTEPVPLWMEAAEVQRFGDDVI